MKGHCQGPIVFQVLKEEKERLVKKDQALAAKFKQFQEEMIRLQVNLFSDIFYKNNIMIDLITRMIISMIIRVSGSKLEVAEMSLTGRVVS